LTSKYKRKKKVFWNRNFNLKVSWL